MSFTSLSGARIPHGPRTPAPVLHMHFDGGFTDETGITTFTGSGVTFETGSSGFGQRAVATGGVAHVFGVSSQELSIGVRPFTIEGRCQFASGQAGGVVISKNYWATEPASGVFKRDFTVQVSPSMITVSWTGLAGLYEVPITTTTDVEFHWAVCDDGNAMRFYVDGTQVGSEMSTADQGSPPPETAGSGITLMGQLVGFLGPNPNWQGSFVGRFDELVMWLDYAKYTDASFTVPTAPYSF